MGLDNGILIYADEPFRVPKCVPDRWDTVEWDEVRYGPNEMQGKYERELCYWRKCWGLRDTFLYILGQTESNDSYSEITVDNIDALLKVIKDYYWHPKKWEFARSIWGYDEMKKYLRGDIIRLSYLKRLLKRGKVRALFYDSW